MIAPSIDQLPHFNPDLERHGASAPHPVQAFRGLLANADGVVFAAPEYAHSLPGVLKNALDWVVGSGELYGKPIAVLAASPRPDGAAMGRAALEQTLRAQGVVIAYSSTVQVRSGLDLDAEVAGKAVGEVLAALLVALGVGAHPK